MMFVFSYNDEVMTDSDAKRLLLINLSLNSSTFFKVTAVT